MELTYPSSDVMRKLYKGIMWYFIAPIAYIFLVIIVAGDFSELTRCGVPIIMCALACYNAYELNKAKAEYEGTARAFLSKVSQGFMLLAVAAVLGLVYMTTTNVKLMPAALILLVLATLAGYVRIARGYNVAAQVDEMRGAGMATRGMWAVVLAIMAGCLIVLIMDNTRPSYSYYGYNESYIRMMMLYQVLFYVVMLVAIGGVFALVYGTRFMVDSAEALEFNAEDDDTTPAPAKADPVTPVAPNDDTTQMI